MSDKLTELSKVATTDKSASYYVVDETLPTTEKRRRIEKKDKQFDLTGYYAIADLEDLDELISNSNSGSYLVTNDLTLDASKTLPSGVTLEFRGGVINGGGFTLTGDDTKINAEPKQIFTNITLGGTYNTKGYPQWFGATADGSTDDTTAVNASFSNLKDIYFVDGTYIVQNVQTFSNQKIELSKNATLKLKAGTLGSSQLLLINGQTNVDISGGTFDGNVSNMVGEKPALFKIAGNTSFIKIDNIDYINACDRVISITTSSNTITDIGIYNCYYDGNGNSAESFIGADNSARTGTLERINIYNNKVIDAHSGIRMYGVNNWKVIGNQINVSRTTATECIFAQRGMENVLIEGNILTTDTQDPFGISMAFEDIVNRNIVITNNIIEAPGTIDTFTSEGMELVCREGGSVEGLVIKGNRIKGEYYGITVGFNTFESGALYYKNVVIDSNSIDTIKRSIALIVNGTSDATQFDDIVISNNVVEVTDNSDGSNDIGIYTRETNTDTTINNCNISNNVIRGGRYGIRAELRYNGFGMNINNNIITDAVDGMFIRGRNTGILNFFLSANISKNNTSSDYVYNTFNSENACIQINDMDSNGLLPSRVTTFDADDTTPSVANGRVFYTQDNTVATAITQLDGGREGQEVIIVGRSNINSTTIVDGGQFLLNGNITFTNNTSLHLITTNGVAWVEISRYEN